MDVTSALEKFKTDLSSSQKEELKKELSAYFNNLLLNDFSSLVQILYRVDVSEQKLTTVLKENKEANAGDLLAELVIQRQEQKSALRNETPPPAEDIPDEERW